MAPLELIDGSDSRLTAPNGYIRFGSSRLRQTLQQMHEVMEKSDGRGLAAPQVGINLRLAVVHMDENIPDKPYECYLMMNPRIVERTALMIDAPEGCLSFPMERWLVSRHSEVTVEYEDEHGKTRRLHAEGWDARCLQHEVDHLNQITIRQSGQRKFTEQELNIVQKVIEQAREEKGLR